MIKYTFILLLLATIGNTWWFWGSDDTEDKAEPESEIIVDKEEEEETVMIKNTVADVSHNTTKSKNEEVNEPFLADVNAVIHEAPEVSEAMLSPLSSDEDGMWVDDPIGVEIPADDDELIGHYDANGEHNQEFDHQAFLGDQAEEFKQLSVEEGVKRLQQILIKVDLNNDSLINVEELTAWIKKTGGESVARRTNTFWKRSNPDLKPELSWDEYRARQYGFLSDSRDANRDGRWVGEDDVDKDTLSIYHKLEQRDRRRWTVADRNKNLLLDKDEFLAFLHPERADYMMDILVLETMNDLDKDGDGKLNLAEYMLNIYGDTKSVAEWESGGLQFKTFRDTDNSGFIEKKELQKWLLPTNYDQHVAEAEHLVHMSDSNGDKLLSMQEAIDRYSMFVGSQATNFGEDLQLVHDEL